MLTSCALLHSLNGDFITQALVSNKQLYAFCWSEDGESLLVGGEGRSVLVLDALTLTRKLTIGTDGASLEGGGGGRATVAQVMVVVGLGRVGKEVAHTTCLPLPTEVPVPRVLHCTDRA